MNSEFKINLNNLFGAKIKRRRKAGQPEAEGFVLGLGLFTYQMKDSNTMREREIYFEHPSVEICNRWSDTLNNYLEGKFYHHKSFYRKEKNLRNKKAI